MKRVRISNELAARLNWRYPGWSLNVLVTQLLEETLRKMVCPNCVGMEMIEDAEGYECMVCGKRVDGR